MYNYVFPAVFTQEENGISIHFPDFEACFTQGDDIKDGVKMANDVLCLTLYDMEQNGEKIPEPTDPRNIKTNDNAFVVMIACDTLEYRKFYENKAIKKTLTIPEWLNEMALKENINFSQVLQNALMEQLHVSK